jgi:uncharacterized protein (DUF2235 family)
MYGLIHPGNEPLVPYAIRMLVGIQRSNASGSPQPEKVKTYFDLASDFKTVMARECKPWFVGVWDTVSSVGWVENPLKLPFTAYNPDIEIGRHAIAIDERRAFFRTNLWQPPIDPAKPSGPKDLKQVWFPGVHCDVGGGYAESESGLAKLALEWMIAEARHAGLLLDETRVSEVLGKSPGSKYVPPNADGCMHESLAGWWRLAEFVPKRHYNWAERKETRRMNLFRRRTIPPKSLVHESAFQRSGGYRNRLPEDAISVSTLKFP